MVWHDAGGVARGPAQEPAELSASAVSVVQGQPWLSAGPELSTLLRLLVVPNLRDLRALGVERS